MVAAEKQFLLPVTLVSVRVAFSWRVLGLHNCLPVGHKRTIH